MRRYTFAVFITALFLTAGCKSIPSKWEEDPSLSEADKALAQCKLDVGYQRDEIREEGWLAAIRFILKRNVFLIGDVIKLDNAALNVKTCMRAKGYRHMKEVR